jgi:hypothetical protein
MERFGPVQLNGLAASIGELWVEHSSREGLLEVLSRIGFNGMMPKFNAE